MTGGESVYIAGIGHTVYSKDSRRSAQALACEAVLAAAQDADISVQAIDAVMPVGGYITAEDVIGTLGLSRVRYNAVAPLGGSSAVASMDLAAGLLRAGNASHIAIVIGRNGRSEARIGLRVRQLAGQQYRESLERPYGWSTPAQWYAMICRRHMDEFGTTKRQLAEVALTMRRHSHRNPNAMMGSRTLALEDYLAAPTIADPYQLFDCSLETDGGVAVILGLDRGNPRDVEIMASATAQPQSPDDLVNRTDWMTIGLSEAAPRAYEVAAIGPSDIDCAMIYDCFTFEVIHQLEEAGFCERGEGGPFVLDGNIDAAGSLPVNTHGGLLSEGHLSGMNHIVEGVRQLRGEASSRQLPNPRIAAVTGWGDLGDGAIAILRRSNSR